MSVLIISNKSDITTDLVIRKLTNRHIDFYRFNTEELCRSVDIYFDFNSSKYYLRDSLKGINIDLSTITSVYYRRPELPTIDSDELTAGETIFLKRELAYTLEGIYKILKNAYWISPVYAIREAENKIFQLEIAKKIGFNIPKSIISNNPTQVNDFISANDNCIIKPIKSGLIEDNTEQKVVFTSTLNKKCISEEDLASCPAYLQENIKKQKDIRVTIVGCKIFAMSIDSQCEEEAQTDWRRSSKTLKYEAIEIPKDIQNKCLTLLSELNLKFGAIDFILNLSGQYIFLEINPNGQWGWVEQQVGYDISGEIANLLENGNLEKYS